ncbi:MAG TPA: hypothetical protein VK389_06840 [Thermoanaerobaculia bacterium]|jgi:hypothetical protein|nr:hypothetical protein [Thermoanaerobaculia bacterium]HLN93561.1 hypothetical protein [Thermoanaerobaculia bacterium]
MKELRAVVFGLVIVILVAAALAFWRRPAPEFARVKGFKVEVKEREGDSTRRVTFSVPANLVARVAKLSPIRRFGGDIRKDWDGDITPREILDAAAGSAPGKPGVIKRGNNTIEVLAEGTALAIDIKDDWGKSVHLRVPRAIVESFSGDREITPREILKKIDELGPGDVVVVRDGDKEVTITAEPR